MIMIFVFIQKKTDNHDIDPDKVRKFVRVRKTVRKI